MKQNPKRPNRSSRKHRHRSLIFKKDISCLLQPIEDSSEPSSKINNDTLDILLTDKATTWRGFESEDGSRAFVSFSLELEVEWILIQDYFFEPGLRVIPFFCGNLELDFDGQELKIFFEYVENRQLDPRELVRPYYAETPGDSSFKFFAEGANFKVREYLSLTTTLFCRPQESLSDGSNRFEAYLGDAANVTWADQLTIGTEFLMKHRHDLTMLRDRSDVGDSALYFFNESEKQDWGHPNPIPKKLRDLAADLNIRLITSSGPKDLL